MRELFDRSHKRRFRSNFETTLILRPHKIGHCMQNRSTALLIITGLFSINTSYALDIIPQIGYGTGIELRGSDGKDYVGYINNLNNLYQKHFYNSGTVCVSKIQSNVVVS